MGFRIPSKELPYRRNDATLFRVIEILNYLFLQRIIFFVVGEPMAALVPKMLINAQKEQVCCLQGGVGCKGLRYCGALKARPSQIMTRSN
jgi:hypothetical protein